MIICDSADLKISARRILSMKAFGSGQMCTNADYILCPKYMVNDLMKALGEVLVEFYPPGGEDAPLKTRNLSKMVHDGAFKRVAGILENAKESGKEIIGGETDEKERRMGITIIKMNEGAKGDSGPLIEEELFGPLLPVIPVKVRKEPPPPRFHHYLLCSLAREKANR